MGALQWQNQAVPFGRGMDTKNEIKNVQAPFLTDLQNGVFNKGGSIVKRNGYKGLPSKVIGSDTYITRGTGLATFQEELLLFTDSQMYSYSPSVMAWLSKGRAASLKGAIQPIVSNPYGQDTPDACYCGTIGVFAWSDTRGGVRASIVDTTTNTTFIADTSLNATATRPRCIASNQYAFVFYLVGATLYLQRAPFGNPAAFLPAQILVTDADTVTPCFDVAFDGTNVLLAYASSTGIRVAYITPSGFIGAQGNGFYGSALVSHPGAKCVAVRAVAGNTASYVAVVTGTASQVYWDVFTPQLVSFSSGGSGVLPAVNAYNVDCAAVAQDQAPSAAPASLVLRVYIDVFGATPSLHRIMATTLTATSGGGTATTGAVIRRGVGLAAKSFWYNGLQYLPIAYGSPLQNTYFLMDDAGNIWSKHLPNQGGGQQSTAGVLPSTTFLTPTQVTWPGLQRQPLRVQGAMVYTTNGVTELMADFGFVGRYQTAQVGDQMYVVGGVLLAYDGNVLVEDGFHVFPEGMTYTTSSTGGSMSNGNYLYYFIYAWTDYQGQVHYSAPSPPQAVTLSGGTTTQSVTWTLPTLQLSLKTGVILEAYRTQNNQVVAYQCSSLTAPILNDPTVDTVAFTDTQADTSIASNQTLYTNGGALSNDDPPQMLAIAATKNRMLGIPAETPSAIWYSKEYIPGTAVGWSLALNKPVPAQSATGTGGATALGFLDDKIIVFKNNGVLYFSGDGPDNNGANDNFTQMEVLSADSGCINPCSPCLISDGLLYQTQKGIRLINRSLSVDDVGAGVYAYATQNQVTSSVSCQDTDQVRFTTAASRALVYDTYWQAPGPDGRLTCGQWSTFTNHTAVGAVLWNGIYCYLSPNGTVYQETPGQFTDNGNFYPLYIQTAWLPLAGPQGYMRVRRANVLGAYISPHTILCQMAYDYRDFSTNETFNTVTGLSLTSWGGDKTWGASTPWGAPGDSVYQFRLNPSRQKCQAIQFSFQDLPNANNAAGQSYSLNNLSLEVGVKKGLFKLGTGKTGQVV